VYIVLTMISCYGPSSKDTQPADTETTPTDTTPSPTDTAPAPLWVGLDLGPDGLCLVAADDSYTCITHAGAEYRYSILQAEHLSVGDGFGCSLNGGIPACTGALRTATPTTPGGYSDLQTGATFACGFQSPYTGTDCWGGAQPTYNPNDELYVVGLYSLCSAKYDPASVECIDTRGLYYHTFATDARLLDMTVGDDRVCVLYETGGSAWGQCGSLSIENLSLPIKSSEFYSPRLIQAASDDTLLCGLAEDDTVKCSDMIDVPPEGRLTFSPRPSTVRDFDAHAGVACVLYEDGKVTCLGVPDSNSKIPIYSADFMP
jgi:hypothetical protein